MRSVAPALAGAILVGSCSASAIAATRLVSFAASEKAGIGTAGHPALGAGGAFLTFSSTAANLLAGDSNRAEDCFYRDLATGALELLSVSTAGAWGNAESLKPVPSVDGTIVTFQSRASNIVAGDRNGRLDVFVRDRVAATTRRVSLSSAGAEANGDSTYPQVSPDGRYVVFASVASNLAASDPNGVSDIFRHDLRTGATEHVSVGLNGKPANGKSLYPAISGDGRYVAFQSAASNLVAGDTTGHADIFVRDMVTGVTERVSVSSTNVPGNRNSTYPDLSDDGRFVIFISTARNLDSGDTNGFNDLFVHDRLDRTTKRLTRGMANTQINGGTISPEMSGNGQVIVFGSDASNLVPGDTNRVADVFTVQRETGAIRRMSVGNDGQQQGAQRSFQQHIAQDGAFVVFSTASGNLVVGDTNGKQDVFLAD
jgi:Tol biopolymer transport system component